MEDYYPSSMDLAKLALEMLGRWDNRSELEMIELDRALSSDVPNDVPNMNYSGPF